MDPLIDESLAEVETTGVDFNWEAAAASASSGPELEQAIANSIALNITTPDNPVQLLDLQGGSASSVVLATVVASSNGLDVQLSAQALKVRALVAGSARGLSFDVAKAIAEFTDIVNDDPNVAEIQFAVSTAVTNAGATFVAVLWYWEIAPAAVAALRSGRASRLRRVVSAEPANPPADPS